MDANETAKWKRAPLKSRWYDDHFGEGAPRGDVVENRLRRLDDRVLKSGEEDLASREVERFFDLFEPGG